MTVFVDTSAIYALIDRSDDGHARALRGRDRVLGEELVTHSYVLVEVVSLVRRRVGPEATARLLDEFLPALRVIDPDAALRDRALASFRAAVHSEVSLVDRASFELMRQLDIDQAYALDDDFTRAGFALVS